MRRATTGVSAVLIALLAAGATACSVATRQTSVESLAADSAQRVAAQHQRDVRDSVLAERIAANVGPRVTIRADFTSYGDSRRVESRFHMYDDAYVLVGHLDADGRLRVAFPQSPEDDGFVQGNKVYTVPSFFAGFTDQFQMRWAYDRYRTREAQLDSYDGGIGYVFVIASWRPMRLDRIADGNRWDSYDIADVSYMTDPREAIEELAGLLAGDNPEAYTVEYAHYLNSNFGSLSLAALSRCPIGSGFYNGFSAFNTFGFPGLGFTPFSLFSPYGYSYNPCGSSYGYGSYAFGGFGYPYGVYRVGYVPPYRQPTFPVGNPRINGRPEIGQRPGHASDGGGSIPTRPQPAAGDGDGTKAAAAQYRRRGLIVENAGVAPGHEASPKQWQGMGTLAGPESSRPSIQEMLNRRRTDMQNERGANGVRGAGGMADESWSRGRSTANPRGTRSYGNEDGAAGSRPSTRSGSSESTGRMSGARGSRPEYTPRSGSAGEMRPAPARSEPRSAPAPHSEPSHAAPPRSEPAPRPSSSNGERRPSRR
ncbi:MAG TPA: DUF4384 domain-containing protein [Gemmatimonadaceae bacterium]|nr:DUF4384 domain-containing protein [Gemmatimonadaceae bacterium]